MNRFSISNALELLERNNIKYTFKGNTNVYIYKAHSFNTFKPNSVYFCRSSDNIIIPENTKDCLFIIHNNFLNQTLPQSNYIFCNNPDLCFCIIASLLLKRNKKSIHPTAVISESAQIEDNVTIGPFTFIGENVIIGNGTTIGSHVTIENATLNNNIKINNGVIIGCSGLGSHRTLNGNWHDFPHFGNVIIEDDVVIQSNTVISRGTLNNTIIKRGVRIGELTMIAHGTCIDEDVFISFGVTIAGSVRVGKQSIVWSHCSIRDGCTIGRNCTIGMGSVVTKNIPKQEIWIGNPAKFFKREQFI